MEAEELKILPGLRRRRLAFQSQLARVLRHHYRTRAPIRSLLYSDRVHGVGGAYPRFMIGKQAVIAVDPDEASPTVNAIMRAALMWSALVDGRIAVVVPKFRAQTIQNRLAVMPRMRELFEWLEWDGGGISPLPIPGPAVQSEVHEFEPISIPSEVAAQLSRFPELQAVMNISGRTLSLRFRGIEVIQVGQQSVTYPLGKAVEKVLQDLEKVRRPGSRHPLARAHQERWLESNLIREIGRVLPSVDPAHIYPQVPSIAGDERDIIDLLMVTRQGRLVVMEIKATADPDLPFQALDYWIAVERHRQAGDFQNKGYFRGIRLAHEPALLVLAAPLLSFHKSLKRMTSVFPKDLSLLQLGLNQGWKREIKILRRQGLLG